MLTKLLFNYHLNIGAILVFLSLSLGVNPSLVNKTPPAMSLPSGNLGFLSFPVTLETKSKFSEKIVTKTSLIPFPVKYQDDPNEELGFEEVVQEGQNGTKETDIKITYFEGEEYEKGVVETRINEPVAKIIRRGIKKVVREKDTPDGKIRYFLKLKVWATSYDAYCAGCTGKTFLGTPVKQGTIAVDPKVIPLGTRIYVPGYGFGIAEDIGGSIKGKRIDLGFETLSGQWSAREVEVYLLE